MLRRLRDGRDPFWDDGVGARERYHRAWIESLIAFAMAIVACGLTAAMWLRDLAPYADRFRFH